MSAKTHPKPWFKPALLWLLVFGLPCLAPNVEAAEVKRGRDSRTKETREELHARAVEAYESAQFDKAAELFAQELGVLSSNDLGRTVELEAREKWILSLYNAGRKDEAVNAFKTLRERYPSFRFNEDEVLPETVAYFEAQAPKVSAAKEIKPVVIAAEPKQPWRWYYLAPLGVGQFVAGSPVRGSIFAVLQGGLIAANVALAVDYGSRVQSNGGTANLAAASAVQTAMNITFFALIGAAVAGVVDGALFEP